MTSPNALADEIWSRIRNFRPHDAVVIRFKAAAWNDIVDALRVASSPAPDVTVEEIIAEANNAYNEFMEDVEDYQGWDGNTHAEAMNRVGGAVMALIERHRTADRWRLYCAQKHRPATTRDGWRDISTAPKDGTWIVVARPYSLDSGWDAMVGRWVCYHSNYKGGYQVIGWQSISSAGASELYTHWQPLPGDPDPSGQVDRASADIDVGVTERARALLTEYHKSWRTIRGAIPAADWAALNLAAVNLVNALNAPPSQGGR